jgi:hypothetical protein
MSGRASLAIPGVACCAALAAGVAYATIPGGSGDYTACALKGVGTIRLVDPSLPPSNLMSHCTSLENQLGWNKQGQAGPPGAKGDAGATGQKGVVGPKGLPGLPGAKGPSGDTGQQGPTGPDGDFSGDFTSPNGIYKVSVTDSGIELRGPAGSTKLGFLGWNVSSFNTLQLDAAQIRLNGCGPPVAVIGGQTVGGVIGVDPAGNPIFGGVATILPPGSPTVCAG